MYFWNHFLVRDWLRRYFWNWENKPEQFSVTLILTWPWGSKLNKQKMKNKILELRNGHFLYVSSFKNFMQFSETEEKKRELWILSRLRGNKMSNVRERQREIETESQQREFAVPTKSHLKRNKDFSQSKGIKTKIKGNEVDSLHIILCRWRSRRRWRNNGNFMIVQAYWDTAVQLFWRLRRGRNIKSELYT